MYLCTYQNKYTKIYTSMARGNLKFMIREMDVNASIKVPKNYEQVTIRNYASIIGREMDRRYIVNKDVVKKQYTITRVA